MWPAEIVLRRERLGAEPALRQHGGEHGARGLVQHGAPADAQDRRLHVPAGGERVLGDDMGFVGVLLRVRIERGESFRVRALALRLRLARILANQRRGAKSARFSSISLTVTAMRSDRVGPRAPRAASRSASFNPPRATWPR